ncbi:MAG: YeeE/YedE family protein [Acidiferrobacterales bacterium]
MSIHFQVLLTIFITAVVMGAVMNKTNFCTMGAVSDWVNMEDKGRLHAWILAMAVAMGGLVVMQGSGLFIFPDDASQTFPPYRTASLAWGRYILGGFIFGIGMTLGSGCGSKTLIRIGGGNIKSIIVLIVGAIVAYIMLHTDFFGLYMLPWISVTTLDLAARGLSGQDIGSIVGASVTGKIAIAAAVAAALLWFVFKNREFRSDSDNIAGGLVVGLAIIIGWYVTGSEMGQMWMEDAAFSDNPPTRVAVQSFTFISPMGDTARAVMNPTNSTFINFGVMALVGVIVGSFLYAILSKRFRIEWFANGKDAVNHIIGGAMMGFGGVLGMGCTVGQGITGVSTLALGSFMVLASIIFGSALTMKVQYNLLDEQGFMHALRGGLADMRLLPAAK